MRLKYFRSNFKLEQTPRLFHFKFNKKKHKPDPDDRSSLLDESSSSSRARWSTGDKDRLLLRGILHNTKKPPKPNRKPQTLNEKPPSPTAAFPRAPLRAGHRLKTVKTWKISPLGTVREAFGWRHLTVVVIHSELISDDCRN